MAEIRIKVENDNKEIALIDNGKLEEYYEENIVENRYEGNIYIGIVKNIVKGMEAAFVDIGTEKNSFIHLKDLLPKINEHGQDKEILDNRKDINIGNITYNNQKVLAQVKKDSTDKKGARISTHINFPSKYIVLMPNTNIITASQKIENKEERERLIGIVKQYLSKNNGAVIRTSAVGKTEELIEDIKYIENKWNNILNINIDVDDNKPRLLYKSEDITSKMLVDLANNNIEKIISNDENELNRIKELIKFDKEYNKTVFEIKQTDNIFFVDNIQKQISQLQKRKIWLNCRWIYNNRQNRSFNSNRCKYW